MLPIFICEDDLAQRKRLEKIIENYTSIEELDMKIMVSTEDPHTLINYLEQNPDGSGLYFFDMDLNCDIDGIALARKARELDPDGKIVFVTAHEELAPSIFEHKIEALDYIVKTDEVDRIRQKVMECIQVVESRQKQSKKSFFKVTARGRTQLVPFQDIMFFEKKVDHDRIDLHLESSQIQFRGVLNEVEESNPNFIRVHRSIVVNKLNIKHVHRGSMELEMVNGEICVLSVRGLRGLKKVLSKEKYSES